MGNKACFTDIHNIQKMRRLCLGKQKKLNYTLYLNQSEKQIWLGRLALPNQPANNFWAQNSYLTHTCFKQIKKDILRTFWTSHYFANKANQSRFELLLKKFAIYFPKIGYTQGLNFLAGYLLLMGFSDSQAFQALIKIAIHQQLLVIGLYEDNFPLNNLFCTLFWKTLQFKMPDVAMKIHKSKLPDQAWIFQWFMSFFLYSFPIQFVKPFFDYIICRKQFAIVALSLGIVKCLRSDICKMQSPDQFTFYQYLDKLKNLQFCQMKIDVLKTINYANQITNEDLLGVLKTCTSQNQNTYFQYFTNKNKRTNLWKQMVLRLTNQRIQFKQNSSSPQYCRNNKQVSHLSRFLHKNSSFYINCSDLFDSSKIKTPNYVIDIDPMNHNQLQSYIEKSRPPGLELQKQCKKIEQKMFRKKTTLKQNNSKVSFLPIVHRNKRINQFKRNSNQNTQQNNSTKENCYD